MDTQKRSEERKDRAMTPYAQSIHMYDCMCETKSSMKKKQRIQLCVLIFFF